MKPRQESNAVKPCSTPTSHKGMYQLPHDATPHKPQRIRRPPNSHSNPPSGESIRLSEIAQLTAVRRARPTSSPSCGGSGTGSSCAATALSTTSGHGDPALDSTFRVEFGVRPPPAWRPELALILLLKVDVADAGRVSVHRAAERGSRSAEGRASS